MLIQTHVVPITACCMQATDFPACYNVCDVHSTGVTSEVSDPATFVWQYSMFK